MKAFAKYEFKHPEDDTYFEIVTWAVGADGKMSGVIGKFNEAPDNASMIRIPANSKYGWGVPHAMLSRQMVEKMDENVTILKMEE